MTIVPATLTRATAVAAVAAGLVFVGVQINHPHLDAASVTTTEVAIRSSLKVLMAALAGVGITGMYLRQVRQVGVLGLVGYLMMSTCYLIVMCTSFVAGYILPSVAGTDPSYVNDVLAVATGGSATGDIGLMQPLSLLSGIGYMAGGVIFGIALFRAGILARWASALLAAGTAATMAIPVLPLVNQRLFAVPTGVALVGLGYSLWRAQRTPAAQPVPNTVSSQLDPAGAK